MPVLYKRSCVPIVLLWMGSSRPVFAEKSDASPDAPSTAIRTSLYAAECTDTPADPQSHGSTTSSDSDKSGFLTRWVKRGLRDQRPAAVTLVIAIDKHACGAPPRNPTNASTDIPNVALFTTAGTLGVFLLGGVARDNPHARETGVLVAESVANSGSLYVVLQLITNGQRLLQDVGRGHFFQTSCWDNSFPSGHTIITWAAASTIAHEYPKPWVEWLTCGTATAVSVTRLTSLQHFPSDIVVGPLGYLIGRHIFHAYCKGGFSRHAAQGNVRRPISAFKEEV